MKLNDIKHNHSLTDLLKVLLFSLIMLLPFLDVGTRCAYVIANKNAYQSYSEVVETTTTQLSDGDSFNDGMMYTFAWNGQMTGATNNKIDVLDGKTNIVDLFFAGETWKVDYFNPSYETTRTRLIVYDTNGNQHNAFMWQEVSNTFYAYTKATSSTLKSNSSFNVYINTYITSKLDNVFEYSVNKLESSPLYNWTTETAIYSGVSTMTTQLGIQGNIIPIILCYWLFITIIYILIDIVIKLFTILTHALGSKTA